MIFMVNTVSLKTIYFHHILYNNLVLVFFLINEAVFHDLINKQISLSCYSQYNNNYIIIISNYLYQT